MLDLKIQIIHHSELTEYKIQVKTCFYYEIKFPEVLTYKIKINADDRLVVMNKKAFQLYKCCWKIFSIYTGTFFKKLKETY